MADDKKPRSGSMVSDAESSRRRRTSSTSSWTGARVVVLALDASDNAKRAFDWFMDNIFNQDDVLILTHCPEAPKLPTLSIKSGFAPPVDEWKKILDEMNAKTRRLEEEYEGTCIQRKLRYKVRGETMKNPGEGLVKIADDENADMIVMGTRGLGGVKRAILGSVSDYVVRNAGIPVIIVPSNEKAIKRRAASISVQSDQAAAVAAVAAASAK